MALVSCRRCHVQCSSCGSLRETDKAVNRLVIPQSRKEDIL